MNAAWCMLKDDDDDWPIDPVTGHKYEPGRLAPSVIEENRRVKLRENPPRPDFNVERHAERERALLRLNPDDVLTLDGQWKNSEHPDDGGKDWGSLLTEHADHPISPVSTENMWPINDIYEEQKRRVNERVAAEEQERRDTQQAAWGEAVAEAKSMGINVAPVEEQKQDVEALKQRIAAVAESANQEHPGRRMYRKGGPMNAAWCVLKQEEDPRYIPTWDEVWEAGLRFEQGFVGDLQVMAWRLDRGAFKNIIFNFPQRKAIDLMQSGWSVEDTKRELGMLDDGEQ